MPCTQSCMIMHRTPYTVAHVAQAVGRRMLTFAQPVLAWPSASGHALLITHASPATSYMLTLTV